MEWFAKRRLSTSKISPTSCVPGIAETGSPLLRMLEMRFAASVVTSFGRVSRVMLEIPAAL